VQRDRSKGLDGVDAVLVKTRHSGQSGFYPP
jgi:hypothetical protein